MPQHINLKSQWIIDQQKRIQRYLFRIRRSPVTLARRRVSFGVVRREAERIDTAIDVRGMASL